MISSKDTIAAISTAQGTGGIGIIRISGKNAVGTADGIFHGKTSVKDMDSHTIQYGKIKDTKTGEIIDEVMLTKMSAPATYTREDVIEINCHGNILIQRRILSLIYENGARPAEPGEFTKRAFLNGRIDLTQAEAVMDLINSKTEKSREAAVLQLSGKISGYINNIIEKLLNIMARIEVTVDYPEHDDEADTAVIAETELKEIYSDLSSAIESYDTGRLLKTGIQTTIVGKPNSGKSTLLNELAGYDRAIVTDIPGTTRDIVEENINIDGILLNLKDTAGIRRSEDVVEQIGIKLAMENIKTSDLVIYVISLSEEDPVDIHILEEIKDKKAIIFLNKEDLAKDGEADNIKEILKGYSLGENIKIVVSSLKREKGAEEIKKAIKDMFFSGNLSQNDQLIITAERHVNLIKQSQNAISDGIDSLLGGMPLDMLSVDIRNAAEYLGEIVGMSISENLIDKIFSSFCIGK